MPTFLSLSKRENTAKKVNFRSLNFKNKQDLRSSSCKQT